MTKRLLSLLLALMMLLSVVPVQVFAVENDPLKQVEDGEEQYYELSFDTDETVEETEIFIPEEEAESGYSEQVIQLQSEIDAIMVQYGVSAEMSDDEIANAIAIVDGQTLEATMIQVDGLKQEIAYLSDADLMCLDTVVFSRFCAVLEQLTETATLAEAEEEPAEVSEQEYEIDSYETFVYYLSLLEELASLFVEENPGEDPLALIIKYIRTGVERYNSGSWGIMAGYENAEFAEFVKMMEDGINAEIEAAGGSEADMIRVSSLKNLKNFALPNGNVVDFGHMFGTMDITYHNKGSVNHADVAGWAGDLVDLLSTTDRHAVSGTLEEMVADISENYLNNDFPGESDLFTLRDMYGDLDGYYLMETLSGLEYEMGALTNLMMEYFTENLTDEVRAAFLLKNRLDDVSLRSAIRDAVYHAYTGNKVIATLEGTREFASENLDDLRKACCYAFADYLCKLAGDYVEVVENSFYKVFSSETAVLAPGITQDIKYATTTDGNQIVYYIATADITRDDVNVYANYNENDPSLGWAMSRVEDQANAAQAKYGDPESEHYIPNYNVIVSTNGAGFNMQTGEPGGLLVMGGVEYHEINNSGFFGILKDGTPVIGTTEEYNTIYKDQVQEGIAGFGARLIRNGEICVSGSDARAPRTAVGITATGKVVLMVLDGRGAPWSVGGGMPEIAQIMYEAGCVEAVNLDGGGSSTFVAKQPGDEALSVVNKPSDGFARSVSASLMMVSTAPSSTAFDHALIESDYRYLTMGSSMQMTAKGVSATGNTAELPEGTYWAVSNENYGSITEDGVFTALRSNGSIDVYLMHGEEVIGSKTVTLVTPDNVYFTKENLNAVYGQAVELPVKALFEGKEIAFQAEDLVFTPNNTAAGTMNGFFFVAAENSGIKNVKVTVSLPDGSRSDTIEISLYNQGEMTFDFDRATGGDRQMAWDRQVTNAITEDHVTYEVIDPDKSMVTSYTFAIDMTQIPIPEVLADLVYMLPGADVEGVSAWDFLLQLAERVSVLTEVKPVMVFDQNFDVDYSELKIINEYFDLKNTEFDEETNTLTLTLNWIDQTQAIDPAVANPMCIVSGIKLTPKADADWGAKSTLSIVNSGNISYKAYLRASALYSFAQKPENQETYDLHPFVNPDIPSEAGAWFGDTYKEFEDTYKLVSVLKEGWYNEDGGFVYYVAGEKLLGIHKVDGLYYDFGETGINVGKTPYSGLVEADGHVYYTKLGEPVTGWHSINDAWYLFDWQTAIGVDGTYNTTVDGVKVVYEFDQGRLTKGYWRNDGKGLQYFYGPYYYKQGWKEIEGETYYFDAYYARTGVSPIRPAHAQYDTWYEFTDAGALVGEAPDGLHWYNGKLYYVVDTKSMHYGFYLIDGDYYYFQSNYTALVDTVAWASKTNDLLPAGTYRFGPDGKINMSTEVVDEDGTLYYYKDGKRTANGGLVKYDGAFYFIDGWAKAVTNTTVWISTSKANGLWPQGAYEFGADGKMIIYNGVHDGYYYVDGVKTYAGLVEQDGCYYFAGSGGKLVMDQTYWVSKHNGLVTTGTYRFDAEGKMSTATEIVNENGTLYYYNNGRRANNAGLVEFNGDYYRVGDGAIVVTNGVAWVSANNVAGLPAGNYRFDVDGKIVMTTEVVDENGTLYYYKDGKRTANGGLVKQDGAYYFIDGWAKAVTNTTVWISTSKANGLWPQGAYEFGADGKMVIYHGVANGYYYVDGVKTYAGLVEQDGCYYFAGPGGKLVTSQTYWVSNHNGLVTTGTYRFDAEGKMITTTGISNENGILYYYRDGRRINNAGLIEFEGSYYRVGDGAIVVTNGVAWVSANNVAGLPTGNYRFGADGKIVMTTEVVDENGTLYYYKDGKRTANGGLVKQDGAYYFIDGWAKAVTNTIVWISTSKANGLWPEGAYEFGADGKMIIYHGVANGYYYVDGIKTYAGLVEQDGSYYFAGPGGKLVTSQTYWVSKHSGLVKTGTYRFDAEGKMIMTTEVVDENGTLYYYRNGMRTNNAGLIEFNGAYYRIGDGAIAVTNAVAWVDANNVAGLPTGNYRFGADGKIVMTTEVVDENGTLYYYKNGKRTANAGLIESNGAYYFIDGAAKAVVSTRVWVSASKSNGLVAEGAYSFGADGKMIIA